MAGRPSSPGEPAPDEAAVSQRDNLDPYTRIFYVPHTVTALFTGVAVLVWFSGALRKEPSDDENAKAGIVACALVYLAYSTLQGPSSVMIRPHPIVWKFVHGCAMLYLLGVVFLLMQGKAAARQFLKFVDPTLGVPLAEREYGTDCRLWISGEGFHTKVLRDTIVDEFVIAHTLGWWAKALIMRNYWLLWTCSIGFELMELTFQHWLPNFNECWWDSWLLDVAICNLGGLLAGMATVKYFGSKKYNWQGISKQKTLLAKTWRGMQQFTPHTLEMWNWATFRSPLRFIQTMTLVAIIMAFELNAFFIKTLLWLPPTNFLVIGRLVLIGILALPGVKEYYTWIEVCARSSDAMNLLIWVYLEIVQTMMLVAIIMAFELNVFFIRTLLWPTPTNFLVVGRLILIGILALPGVKEYYTWIESKDMNVFTKLGPYAWISGAILSAETLLVVKFGRGEFTAPFPERVKIAWGIFGASLTVVLVGWQLWIWIFSYLQRASPPNESSLNQKQKAY